MPEMTTLHDALVDEIKDLYSLEKQLVKALPKMARKARSEKLRDALESHLEETQNHVSRIEEAFDLLDMTPRAKHCAGIAGIIEEAGDALEEAAEDPVMDAMIIAGGQRAEHYGIGAYGTVVAWAEALELEDLAELMRQTLAEEKAADETLTRLAEEGINAAAVNGAAQTVGAGTKSGSNGRARKR